MPIYGFESSSLGTSLVVQWLRLQVSPARGMGSILGWGTKIPHIVWPQKKKKKCCGLNVAKKSLHVLIMLINYLLSVHELKNLLL